MPSVLIFALDGLQPAQVNLKLMPNLSALAAKGVTFAKHHAVFPTVTRTNVSSLVTGRHPGGHGLAANFLVIREFEPHHPLPAMEPQLDQADDGHLALWVGVHRRILELHALSPTRARMAAVRQPL